MAWKPEQPPANNPRQRRMPRDNSWLTSDAGIFLRRQRIMSKIESWHETFFDGLYGKVLAELFNEEQSKKEARLVKYLARIRKGHSALDVPCGQGRLTFPLSDMGLVMTGVDRTQSYIRKARRVARDRELNLRFECADMREIEFEEEFDAAFNWFGSFGYFSDDENVQFLRRVYLALKPGGRFLIDVWFDHNAAVETLLPLVVENQWHWHLLE